jgi:hypothetical protein
MAAAATAFGHGGHVHSYLGTVKSLSGTSLVITTTESKDVSLVVTDATSVTRGGKVVNVTELKSGIRVAIHVADDGRTATSVKVAK